MADAKKCDRCGRFYSLHDKDISVFKVGHRNHHGIFLAIDLCEECQEALDAFMSFGGHVGYEEESDEQESQVLQGVRIFSQASR